MSKTRQPLSGGSTIVISIVVQNRVCIREADGLIEMEQSQRQAGDDYFQYTGGGSSPGEMGIGSRTGIDGANRIVSNNFCQGRYARDCGEQRENLVRMQDRSDVLLGEIYFSGTGTVV